jgi:nucleotide-binding universal stress UspA family protein
VDWNAVKRVVAPVDLEDADEHGVRLALQAAGDPAEVHVLYVLSELEPSLMTQIDDATRVANARQALRAWLDEQGFSDAIRIHVRVGSAPTLIATLAETVEAGLVIVPSHGRTGLRRALMGSVAERATRLAPCPVLVLKR